MAWASVAMMSSGSEASATKLVTMRADFSTCCWEFIVSRRSDGSWSVAPFEVGAGMRCDGKLRNRSR